MYNPLMGKSFRKADDHVWVVCTTDSGNPFSLIMALMDHISVLLYIFIIHIYYVYILYILHKQRPAHSFALVKWYGFNITRPNNWPCITRSKHKDKSDQATVEKALDKRTTMILYKLLNRVYTGIDGCISTGKEANVYHATSKDGRSLAVKVAFCSSFIFVCADLLLDVFCTCERACSNVLWSLLLLLDWCVSGWILTLARSLLLLNVELAFRMVRMKRLFLFLFSLKYFDITSSGVQNSWFRIQKQGPIHGRRVQVRDEKSAVSTINESVAIVRFNLTDSVSTPAQRTSGSWFQNGLRRNLETCTGESFSN